jgi:DNA-binding HxlR family transcriptional regulator
MPAKKYTHKSGCPVVFFTDVFGDKWSLLILRDIFFAGRKHYNDFLLAGEGIATNILADRLSKLEQLGLLNKEEDPENRRKYLYSPTEKALDLIPLFIEMILWSARYDEGTEVPPKLLRRFQNQRAAVVQETRSLFL